MTVIIHTSFYVQALKLIIVYSFLQKTYCVVLFGRVKFGVLLSEALKDGIPEPLVVSLFTDYTFNLLLADRFEVHNKE